MGRWWTAIEKIVYDTFVHKNPVFLFGIFFGLVGVQVIFFGLLAELSVRTHFESQERAAYFIRERVNFGSPGDPGADDGEDSA